jgi:phage terminase Nu1 subunit (DNA packaging protein)
MDDQDILSRIHDLVSREDELRERGAAALDPGDRASLDGIERDLDQCWDLLRQRRAKREAGDSPAEAEVRPEDTVESYLQ